VDHQAQKVSSKSGHYLNSGWVWWQTKRGKSGKHSRCIIILHKPWLRLLVVTHMLPQLMLCNWLNQIKIAVTVLGNILRLTKQDYPGRKCQLGHSLLRRRRVPWDTSQQRAGSPCGLIGVQEMTKALPHVVCHSPRALIFLFGRSSSKAWVTSIPK